MLCLLSYGLLLSVVSAKQFFSAPFSLRTDRQRFSLLDDSSFVSCGGIPNSRFTEKW